MLGDWKSIIIPDTLRIKNVDGYRGVAFAMPKASAYEGYSFWHTKKLLTRLFSHDWELLYRSDFRFHLRLYKNVESEARELISEIEISAEEFEQAMQLTCA